ncbi:MAG: hypothetical protein MZW92_09480, partial [Comamonadaceae bacterium]|nr:hypothetical protein [Comamonadaceae bacterium]
ADSARGDSMQHQFVDNGGGPAYPAPADLGSRRLRRPGCGPRLAGRLSVVACRPRSLGTPLPGEHRVPLRRPRRGIRHRGGAAQRRLVARHVLHLGRPERPVRDALRRQPRLRRPSPGRRPDLHHLGRHALECARRCRAAARPRRRGRCEAAAAADAGSSSCRTNAMEATRSGRLPPARSD